jgi:hypothetical protein
MPAFNRAEKVQAAVPATPRYPRISTFRSAVGQTLTAGLNIGLHAIQPHADSQQRSKAI